MLDLKFICTSEGRESTHRDGHGTMRSKTIRQYFREASYFIIVCSLVYCKDIRNLFLGTVCSNFAQSKKFDDLRMRFSFVTAPYKNAA